jgi:hypothetical protein
MTRPIAFRLFAVFVGLSSGLAGPALALVHGHAHSEATEHGAHHSPAAPSESDHRTIGHQDHDQDHAHPRLDPSACARFVTSLPAITTDATTLALVDVAFRDSQDAPEPNESPPDRPGISPPQSRAPPVL